MNGDGDTITGKKDIALLSTTRPSRRSIVRSTAARRFSPDELADDDDEKFFWAGATSAASNGVCSNRLTALWQTAAQGVRTPASSLGVHDEETIRNETLQKFFEGLDLDGSGLLERHELQAILIEASKTTKMPMDESIIEAAIDALLEDVQSEKALKSMALTRAAGNTSSTTSFWAADAINLEQFIDMFHRHPDMYRLFETDKTSKDLKEYVKTRQVSPKEQKLENKENEQAWSSSWIDWNVTAAWLVLYILATIIAFATKAYKYANHDEAQA
ncbi:unknown protein (Partial), partial [Seminavis robusta]|eukprot:Sro522_g159690.1 n/a (272) ;mRNA; f:61211-62027